METDDTQRPPDAAPSPPAPRRFPARIVLIVIGAIVAVAFAANFALARTRPAGTGTGVVVIDTNLAYQDSQAAGTGMVLTSSGVVLTNNHVIRDATAIKIVVPSTGRSYTARVVGYDPSHDVAVLQAEGASNLKTISLGKSAGLGTGQSVKAIGNAGGTGSLVSVSGTVTGVNRAITVSDDQGGSEHLSGLIETNAGIRPGDSGGPLMNAAGQVIGMDTAASMGSGYQQASASDGFAIPIDTAASIAMQIERGQGTSSVHVGDTAFLGVEVEDDTYGGSGAVISSVVPGGPADAAGLVPGDLITSFGGHSVSSSADLTTVVMAQKPGSSASVTYADQNGETQTANVTLGKRTASLAP